MYTISTNKERERFIIREKVYEYIFKGHLQKYQSKVMIINPWHYIF